MNKCILITSILLIFFSCVRERKGNLTIPVEFVDSLLKEERICIDKKERVISYLDTIKYSDEINQIIFENDTIIYRENNKREKIINLINNKSLKKYLVQNSQFNVDSMDFVIDLNELEIYYLKHNFNIIIIKSKPMNWVGTMTRFSFFQLINKNEKTLIEFIREEE